MENDCRIHGGHLAEIRGKKANNIVHEMRRKTKTAFIVSGGNDQEEEGRWVWPSDGHNFYNVKKKNNGPIVRDQVAGMFQNWATIGDKVPVRNTKKNCMIMVKDGPNKGMWKDWYCKIGHVLCEATPVKGEAIYLESLAILN